ncbi:DUF177 domain-containing protein [uncultured Oscillibacter sp.]|uniref:YceD family protein n=1 Tax=uncultured Oscillibacter sp. TaxID=876091 RepID=UPI0025FE707F|nr:DUF177 domain-containing protein [uncultured Oscillibacter sp.]
MRFDVKPILNSPGRSLDFQFTLDLSDTELNGQYPVQEPVEVRGSVRNTAGLLELSMTVSAVLDAACDRCAKPLRLPKQVEFRCMLAETLENGENDEIVLLEDGEVDVEDLARTAFILDMDAKFLCSEDCKGLCPRCGADLNLGPCGCGKETDPRLAALAALLENNAST